jgi:uncharacterized OsmC-like protein
MKVNVLSAGGVASRVQLGSHELVFDQDRNVPHGEDRGPSPLDVMATAVAACAHYYAAAFLAARTLPVEQLRVEIEWEKVREPVPRLGLMAIRVMLPEGVPTRYYAAIEHAVRHCPAYGTLLHPPDVTLEVVVPNGPGVSKPAA